MDLSIYIVNSALVGLRSQHLKHMFGAQLLTNSKWLDADHHMSGACQHGFLLELHSSVLQGLLTMIVSIFNWLFVHAVQRS